MTWGHLRWVMRTAGRPKLPDRIVPCMRNSTTLETDNRSVVARDREHVLGPRTPPDDRMLWIVAVSAHHPVWQDVTSVGTWAQDPRDLCLTAYNST